MTHDVHLARNMADANYLGTSYPTPTDPSYYLNQVGLTSLAPQAFNANTLSSLFSPQGFQYSPVNNMATNPFVSQFLDSSAQEMKLPHKQTGGLNSIQPGQQDPMNFAMGY